jgi:hypothetical protein
LTLTLLRFERRVPAQGTGCLLQAGDHELAERVPVVRRGAILAEHSGLDQQL